jgi:hypothetical protein
VRLNRLRAAMLLLVGSAYFIDLFLPWIHERGESASGWDLPVISTNGSVVLALVLVEAARARDVWRTTTSALLGFFLAAGAALLGVAGLVHMRWGSPFFFHANFSDFAYGAWISLALALALLAGAVIRLTELERATNTPGPTA